MLKISQKKRKIGYTSGSVSGRYPFRGEKSVAYESQLEADFLMMMEFNDAVVDVEGQPFTIEKRCGDGRTRRYTPDFLVQFRSNGFGTKFVDSEGLEVPNPKPLLVEVKRNASLKKDWAELEPRLRMGMRYALENDMVFKIYDESRIHVQYYYNVKKLRRYKRYEYDPIEEERIVAMVETLGHCTIEMLLLTLYVTEEQKGLGLGQVYQLLATKRLLCDLTLPLGPDTTIWRPSE